MSSHFQFFLDDSFFHAEEWPTYAQEIVLSKDFVYDKRCAMALFFVGNGLIDAEVAEKIFKIWNIYWDNSKQWNKRFSEFANLFKYYTKPKTDPDSWRIASTYSYYDMGTNRNLYLDGQPVMKKQKKKLKKLNFFFVLFSVFSPSFIALY